MIKKLIRAIPHLSIILSGMLLTLLVIDRINSAMNFINNNYTKIIIVLLCLLAVFQSIIQIIVMRHPPKRKKR